MSFATFSAPRWTRRTAPKSRFKRRNGGRGHKRPRPALRKRTGGSFTRTKRQKTERASGGYNQWERRKLTTGRRISSAVMDKRLVRASREYKILGHRNLKAFDDFGAVPCCSQLIGPVHYNPIHVYALNASNSDTVAVEIARQLVFNDTTNAWSWSALSGLSPLGGTIPSVLQVRKQTNDMNNQGVQFCEYTHVKMNVWGAKMKPIRYQIDVVSPLSDEVSPFHWTPGVAMDTAGAQAWEEMVKQYTYNPIAKFDHYIKRNFKTIKSMSFIIDPTSITEADADPHVKTIDWFMRMNKTCHYDKVSKSGAAGTLVLQDGNQLKTAANYAPDVNTYFTPLPRDKELVFLMIRASDYTTPGEDFTNTVHGSYDLDFATKFTQLG